MKNKYMYLIPITELVFRPTPSLIMGIMYNTIKPTARDTYVIKYILSRSDEKVIKIHIKQFQNLLGYESKASTNYCNNMLDRITKYSFNIKEEKNFCWIKEWSYENSFYTVCLDERIFSYINQSNSIDISFLDIANLKSLKYATHLYEIFRLNVNSNLCLDCNYLFNVIGNNDKTYRTFKHIENNLKRYIKAINDFTKIEVTYSPVTIDGHTRSVDFSIVEK